MSARRQRCPMAVLLALLVLLAAIGGPAAAQTSEPQPLAPPSPATAAPPPAAAPASGLAPGPAKAGDTTIQIEADRGIELQREARLVIATGNVKAVRGDLTVTADRLTAAYRERPDGAAEVFQLRGDGNVKIVSPSETLTSDRATYDMDKEVLIATVDKGGSRARLVTKGGEVTADQRLEYARPSRMLVAVGNAVAIDGDQTVQGDTITAFLRADPPPGKDSARFERVEAEGHVQAISGGDRIVADRGTFNGDSEVAVFTGAVQVFRGDSVLNGCRAEIEMVTGVSRLYPCSPGTGGSARVHGVIVPGQPRAQQN